VDVLRHSCFNHYETIACVRSTLLVVLTAVTGLMCARRVISLHLSSHPNYYQYAIFYLAVIQCITGTVEWVLGWTLQASLLCLYLRCLELVIICHFYLTLYCRITHRSNGLSIRLFAAVLAIFLTYFTSFMTLGFAFSDSSWSDCYANYWLFLSGGQLILIQLLAASALLVMHHVKAVQTTFKKNQRRGVWLLIASFEMSAIAGISYDFTLWALATEEQGCSGIFLHKQTIYSPVRVTYEVLTSLLPLWTMLYVFQTVKHKSALAMDESVSTDRRHLVESGSINNDTHYSSTGSTMVDPSIESQIPTTSIIQPRIPPPVSLVVTKRHAPSTSPPSSWPAPIQSRRRIRSYIGGIPGRAVRIKRCNSMPSSFRQKRTPPLATIPEEPTRVSQEGPECS